MPLPPSVRKVLVVEDEPAIRNVLYVLLAGIGCQGDAAYNGQQALAMISRESYDAVLLDLRCLNLSADHVLTQINDLHPNLVGRVLVITGEIHDSTTLKTIERLCVSHVPHERLSQDLWGRLKAVLGLSGSPKTES